MKVSIGFDEVGDALPVIWVECFYGEVALGDGSVEARFGNRAKLAVDQPTGFSDDERGGDQRTRVSFEDRLTAVVVGIGVIRSSQDDVRVDEEAQRPNPSASRSSSSVARLPLVERPKLTKPRLRRAGNRSTRTWRVSS